MKRMLYLFLVLVTVILESACSSQPSQPMDQSEQYDVVSAINSFYAPFYGKSTTSLAGKYQELISLYHIHPIPGSNPPKYDVKKIIVQVNGGADKATIREVKGKGLAYIWKVSDLPFFAHNPEIKNVLSKIAFVFKKNGRLSPIYFFSKHQKSFREAWNFDGGNPMHFDDDDM